MKKILLTIIAIICSISIVKAEAILEYDLEWISKGTQLPLTYTYDYKDSYLFVDYSEDLKCSISLYDKKGNLIKESNIEGLIIGLRMDDYIYIAINKQQAGRFVITWSAYDENLEKLNETTIVSLPIDSPYATIGPNLDALLEQFKKMIKPVEDGIIVLAMKGDNIENLSQENIVSLYELRKYKKDLSSYEVIPNTSSNEDFYEYLDVGDSMLSGDEIRRKYNLLEKYNVIKLYTKGNTNVIVVESEGEGFFLLVFDKFNQLYEKKISSSIPERQTIEEVKIVDNHIMITFNDKRSLNNIKTSLNIYDLTTGELEKEINSKYYLFNITDTKRGFLYHEKTCIYKWDGNEHSTANFNQSLLPTNLANNYSNQSLHPTNLANENCTTQRHIYAHYSSVITKVIEGNGQIIVDERQVPGDKVTLTIKPDEGYEIKEVKVTGAKGNIIPLTDYTFIMPNEDVTVEATFVKIENPNTKSKYSLIFLYLVIFAYLFVIYNVRKMELSK